MSTSSSLPPLRKRPLNNPSGHESDGCTSRRFKIVPEEEEYRWFLPTDMTEYDNENSEKFIPEKDVKEAFLLKLPRSKLIIQLKSWMIFYWSYLNKRRKLWISQ